MNLYRRKPRNWWQRVWFKIRPGYVYAVQYYRGLSLEDGYNEHPREEKPWPFLMVYDDWLKKKLEISRWFLHEGQYIQYKENKPCWIWGASSFEANYEPVPLQHENNNRFMLSKQLDPKVWISESDYEHSIPNELKRQRDHSADLGKMVGGFVDWGGPTQLDELGMINRQLLGGDYPGGLDNYGLEGNPRFIDMNKTGIDSIYKIY